jgi:hypothetical protein
MKQTQDKRELKAKFDAGVKIKARRLREDNEPNKV